MTEQEYLLARMRFNFIKWCANVYAKNEWLQWWCMAYDPSRGIAENRANIRELLEHSRMVGLTNDEIFVKIFTNLLKTVRTQKERKDAADREAMNQLLKYLEKHKKKGEEAPND